MSEQTATMTQRPARSLDGFVGKRFEYIYANGWRYEMYVKNATTIDYQIHSGMVGGRRVKDQKVDLVVLTEGVYKVSWTEPTGTSVCVTLVPAERVSHGVIFFPRWVEEHPERTVVFQNDHLDHMRAYRTAFARPRRDHRRGRHPTWSRGGRRLLALGAGATFGRCRKTVNFMTSES
ncbi:phenolic acid decarboxylase [Lentzea sp. E54]|uniref:phenolic acid decarboxylase n=1 Tax=Lentzea xerophila TaxID=3435883 RepID=UPI003DA1D088